MVAPLQESTNEAKGARIILRMRIGINLLYLIPSQCGGTETYGICLVNALSALDSANQYVVFLNRDSKDIPLVSAPNITIVPCNVRAMVRPFRYLYEQFILPLLLIRYRIDLLHSLGYVSPLIMPCLNIVTVHDMNYIDRKADFHWLKRFVLSFFSIASIRLADHIITISEFSKDVICDRLGTDPSKITVTHLGPGWLDQTETATKWSAVQEKYGLPSKYIIAFGGGALHKNIGRLIEAYLDCTEAHDRPLIIMGRLPANVSVPHFDGATGPRIQCLGYVPTSEIMTLLAHSDLYVLPSLYEGFGLPILEAQAAGALVASSNAASLPEIGGDGAIYFDPLSVQSISEAMRKGLTESPSWIASIRSEGEKNLMRFSWMKTAKASLDVYRLIFDKRKIGKNQ